jgi:hypothetical protein
MSKPEDKPEVHQVVVDIAMPSPRLPAGQSALGYYTVVDGLLTMTCPQGKAAEDAEGKTYKHKLEPNDDARVIAGRLTKQLRSALRGDRPPGFGGSGGGGGFNGPINYPKSSIF